MLNRCRKEQQDPISKKLKKGVWIIGGDSYEN
jgi:hypothetical protein